MKEQVKDVLKFCDKEVSCILDMDRNEILDCFFQGHMDDIVCVFDVDGNYKGRKNSKVKDVIINGDSMNEKLVYREEEGDIR